MFGLRNRKYALLFLTIALLLSVTSFAQTSPDFAGNWVLRLQGRPFLVLSLHRGPAPTAAIEGSLTRVQHFGSSNGAGIYGVQGQVLEYALVKSAVKGNCLAFTSQNPQDKKDEDDFEFCVSASGYGALRFDFPGFDAWSLSKEDHPPAIATDWDSSRTYFIDDTGVSNAEMQRIFDEDQRVRQPGTGNIDREKMSGTDASRRAATAKLLADGKLHTGDDFEYAAFVFQHGDTPDDYLLAHTLAMVAVVRGKGSAIWIASATLDRYLQSIQKPQIYGTQFFTKDNQPTTQEPYNRTLISDSLRKSLGVPSQAAQEEQRKRYDEQGANSKKQ